jgi:hypothetical protein
MTLADRIFVFVGCVLVMPLVGHVIIGLAHHFDCVSFAFLVSALAGLAILISISTDPE